MFDPTAFDNMKVVLEGALYDRDICGEIVIKDRNDWINMAKMSRQFDVSFQLPNSSITAKIEMESKLVNLAAELIPGAQFEKHAGCYVRLHFFLEHGEGKDYQTMQDILLDVWGATRKITMSVQYNPLKMEKRILNVLTVEFDRLLSEDHIDDLVEMIDFMMTTLKNLSKKI